jgi:acetyl esterase
MERRGDPPLETLPPPAARARAQRQAVSFAGPPIPVGDVRDLQVPGAEGPLGARLYAPLPEPVRPAPLLVYLHGGGYVIGDLESHDQPCRLLCRQAGVHVLAVDYRLAPEHPFPAAADDAGAVLRWALEHAAELGADPGRVAVGGDSAGGNLAAVACQDLRDQGGRQPALQLLIYPGTDFRGGHPSVDLFGDGFYLTRSQMDWFGAQYAGHGADLSNPRLSPLLGDLRSLPPAIVVTAAMDPLRDEGEAYAEALREAGTPVMLRRCPGLIHAFVNFIGVSRVARDAVVEMAGGLRALLTPPATSPHG